MPMTRQTVIVLQWSIQAWPYIITWELL